MVTPRIFGRSVRGTHHIANGLPNQDAIAFAPLASRSQAAVLAVSDGHGSPTCFRSDAGARFATEAAVETLGGITHMTSASTPLLAIDTTAHRRLIEGWRARVATDLRRSPFSATELRRLDAHGRAASSVVLSNPHIAYGATVLAVVVTEKCAAYLQLGDGDILARSVDGRTRRIFARDERFAQTETMSLCLPEAMSEIRSSVEPLNGAPPALILVSTDGYANSFRTDADFLQIAADYARLIVTDGLAAVADSLERHLFETSAQGSGDDITLGIVTFATSASVAHPIAGVST